MQPLVAGFWGAYFGIAILVIAGAAPAYLRGLRRVALLAASASLLSIAFVTCYVQLLPMPDASVRLRVDAFVFILSAVLLGHMVLAMIGQLRTPAVARRWRTGIYGYGIVVNGVSWLLPPRPGFTFCTTAAYVIGIVAMWLCVRRAQRGDRLAGLAILGVLSICVSGAALTFIALDPAVPWEVHAIAALGSIGYLLVVSIVLWLRFSYLFELQKVMQHGAAYDPITRMRTHSETGQMVGLAFFEQAARGEIVGVIAVSIGNLLALEQLHGHAAINHGLFVSAGRLRRMLPGGVEAGRLEEDAFLVLVRGVDDVDKLVELAHEIVRRLARPVALSTAADPGALETGQAYWVAQVGVGIVVAAAADRPSAAIRQARSMSRAAWGFPSRVAWQDDSGHVAEAPALASA